MGQSKSRSNQGAESSDYVSVNSYTGEVRNGMRYGKGIFMYANGDIYDGEWKKDRRYGYGKYTFADGTVMEGYFYKDKYLGDEPKGKLEKKLRYRSKRIEGQRTSEPLKQPTAVHRANCHEQEDGAYDRPQGLKERNLEPEEREELRRRQAEVSLKREESRRLAEAMRQKYQVGARKEKNEKEIRENIRTKYSLPKGSASSANSYKGAEQLDREENKKIRESLRAKYNLNKR